MSSQPTPPPNLSMRSELVVDPSRGPIRLVIEHPRPSWFGRVVRWALVIFVALWLAAALGGFYSDDDGLSEHWHSLSKSARQRVAIISVEGTIFGDENFVKKQIERVRDDERVVAVVLRVDSPGGTVTGSDYIYHHLKELVAEKKIPLIVSMGSIAASGGYYVAMAAGDGENTIFAEPTTWTGSIGVVIPHYDLSGLLAKIDVQDDSIASNPLKLMGSPTRKFPEPIRAEEQQILQGLVDASFADFKQIVLASRKALRGDQAAQDEVFTGRIFTAKQAQQKHLVDSLGFVEDAIERAIELAGLNKDEVRVVEYRQPRGILDQMLFGPQSLKQPFDLASLVELNVPRPYYLCTWMPGLGVAAKQ